jgi:DNA-binding GntR family transcriptional regulator
MTTGPEPSPRRRRRESLKTVSAIDAVANAIRARVVAGEFSPGAQLREIDLTGEYGVARPTVRAALQRLVLTGLLRREANQSAFVPRLTPEDVHDLFHVRGLIERDVVRRLTEAGEGLEGAERAVARLEAFGTDANWGEVVEADLEFHRALTEATGSTRLLRLFELLEDEIRLAVAQLRPAYTSPAELAHEHRRLMTAIATRETSQAHELLREHLEQAVGELTSDAVRHQL